MKTYNTVSTLEKVQPQWSALQEVQLSYRNEMKASQRPKINMADDALSLFRSVWNENWNWLNPSKCYY